jgi:hypothetical protein
MALVGSLELLDGMLNGCDLRVKACPLFSEVTGTMHNDLALSFVIRHHQPSESPGFPV